MTGVTSQPSDWCGNRANLTVALWACAALLVTPIHLASAFMARAWPAIMIQASALFSDFY